MTAVVREIAPGVSPIGFSLLDDVYERINRE